VTGLHQDRQKSKCLLLLRGLSSNNDGSVVGDGIRYETNLGITAKEPSAGCRCSPSSPALVAALI
jgi:hypothetical protein